MENYSFLRINLRKKIESRFFYFNFCHIGYLCDPFTKVTVKNTQLGIYKKVRTNQLTISSVPNYNMT